MADVPVALLGCVRHGQNVTRTYVHVRDSLTLVETVHHGRDNVRILFSYPHEFLVYIQQRTNVPVVMGALELPLARLLSLIDRVPKNPYSYAYGHLPESTVYPGLESLCQFRAAAISHAVRVKAAARTIERQFREAMANPAYQLCKKRLHREFESMGDMSQRCC
jgi:hypothetical protein